MGRLLSRFRSVGGEKALGSAFGRWCQAVGSLLDGVLNPPYVVVRRASSNQSVDFTAGEDLVFNAVVEDGGVAYDPATGVFTLAAGLYELEFYGAWTNFGTPDVTAATAEWVSHPSNVALAVGLTTWVVSATGTQNTGCQPVAKVLYPATAGEQVKVRATSAGGGGTADLLRGSSYASVRKVA